MKEGFAVGRFRLTTRRSFPSLSLFRPYVDLVSYSVTPSLLSGYYVLSHKWLARDNDWDDLDVSTRNPIDPLVLRQLCLMAAALNPDTDDVAPLREVLQREAQDDLVMVTLGLLDRAEGGMDGEAGVEGMDEGVDGGAGVEGMEGDGA